MGETVIVYETHSWTEDNERGRSTGWHHGRLSARGRELARVLGDRRRDDGIHVVLVSDLRRAVETAEIAFEGSDIPILHDWRLRECDYGDLNGRPTPIVHAAVADVHQRHPGGESWAEAVARVDPVIDDIAARWAGERVLVIGHMSAYWALEHRLAGMAIEDIGRPFDWREGWEYRVPDAPLGTRGRAR